MNFRRIPEKHEGIEVNSIISNSGAELEQAQSARGDINPPGSMGQSVFSAKSYQNGQQSAPPDNVKIGNLVVKNHVQYGRSLPHSNSLSQIRDNTGGGYLSSGPQTSNRGIKKKKTFNPSGMVRRHNDIIEESQEDLNDDELDQSPSKKIHEDEYGENTPSVQKLDINSLDEENLSVGLGVNRMSGTQANRNANRIVGRGQPTQIQKTIPQIKVPKTSESSSGGVKSQGAVAVAIRASDHESSIGADREAHTIKQVNHQKKFIQNS